MDIFFASFFKSLSTLGSLNTDESACTCWEIWRWNSTVTTSETTHVWRRLTSSSPPSSFPPSLVLWILERVSKGLGKSIVWRSIWGKDYRWITYSQELELLRVWYLHLAPTDIFFSSFFTFGIDDAFLGKKDIDWSPLCCFPSTNAHVEMTTKAAAACIKKIFMLVVKQWLRVWDNWVLDLVVR